MNRQMIEQREKELQEMMEFQQKQFAEAERVALQSRVNMNVIRGGLEDCQWWIAKIEEKSIPPVVAARMNGELPGQVSGSGKEGEPWETPKSNPSS